MANDNEYVKLMQELKENLRLSEKEENAKNEKNEKDEIRNDDFELITGYRDGSTLLWVRSESCFYKQNTYSKTHDGLAYTCYDSECKARKVLPKDESRLITLAATHIPHLSMTKMYKELHYLNLMKSMCKTEPHSVSVAQIYERVQAM